MTVTENVPAWFGKKYDPTKESLEDYMQRAERELMHDYDKETRTGIRGYSKFREGTIREILFGVRAVWGKAIKLPPEERPYVVPTEPILLIKPEFYERKSYPGVKIVMRNQQVRYQYPKGTYINGKKVSGRFYSGKEARYYV